MRHAHRPFAPVWMVMHFCLRIFDMFRQFCLCIYIYLLPLLHHCDVLSFHLQLLWQWLKTKCEQQAETTRLPNTLQEGRWKDMMMKMGLNDARRIVWAISKYYFFFLIFCVFLFLINFLQYLYIVNYKIHYRKGGGRWWWWKWAQMMQDASFGLLVSVF